MSTTAKLVKPKGFIVLDEKDSGYILSFDELVSLLKAELKI